MSTCHYSLTVNSENLQGIGRQPVKTTQVLDDYENDKSRLTWIPDIYGRIRIIRFMATGNWNIAQSPEGLGPQFESIRLLTYNLFIRPPAPKFTHNVVDDRKDERLDAFIAHYLSNYDVIAFEEVFGSFSYRRERLIKAAKILGFHWSIASPTNRRSGYLVDGGCLILSRVQIVSTSYVFYTDSAYSDNLAAKGALYAKLMPSENQYIHLFCTHLQATYSSGDYNLSRRVRKRQLETLVEFMRKTVQKEEQQSKRPSYPCYLVGDFNVNALAGNGEYESLIERLDSVWNFRVIDVAYEMTKKHPVTYGEATVTKEGQIVPNEMHLSTPNDFAFGFPFINQCIDYCFYFSGQIGESRFVPNSFVVSRFNSFVPAPLTQLSDHFGLEVLLSGIPTSTEDY